MNKKAYFKVVLFVIRVQHMCRKKFKKRGQRSSLDDSYNSNQSVSRKSSCSTSPRPSVQVSECFMRKSTKRKDKYLSWSHLNETFDNDEKKNSVGGGNPLMSDNRSVSWTNVDKCQNRRKSSCPEWTMTIPREMTVSSRKLNFTQMNKPYSFVASASSEPSSSWVDGQNRCQGKRLTISCNSVMGNPKKFGRRFINNRRRSSSGELTGGDDFAGEKPNYTKSSLLRPPMLRTMTADCGDVRLRCVSDENVAQNPNTRSPKNIQKFAKRKSSADLLEEDELDRDSVSSGKLFNTSGLSKAEKKRMEKLKTDMSNIIELFTAIEQDDIGKVRSMLQHGDIDMTSSNMDNLSLLDVAVMLNHTEVALLLLQYGAQENQKLGSPTTRLKHVDNLLENAQKRLNELNLQCNETTLKTISKQVSCAESRVHMLKKMKNNFNNFGFPRPPRNIVIRVASATSILVTFEPPEQLTSVVTKYKVEWSSASDFCNVKGSILIKDLRRLDVLVPNLHTGRSYYVRISAGNFKGFGQPGFSTPEFVVPSSWREVNGKELKTNRIQELTELHFEMNKVKASESWERSIGVADVSSRRKKSTLRTYFTGGFKFQKALKRGVYLATILYKGDKILCTVDEAIPVLEVDDNIPGCIHSDFMWFMKVACAWEDIKALNFSDFAGIHHSANLLFRWKLLEAAMAMQMALGVEDLGRLHYNTLMDSRGVTVLVTVQYVHEPKSVQGLAVKWMSINKLFKRQSQNCSEKDGLMDLLMNNLLNFLNFYESTNIPLDRGLYMGYVKLHSSMNQISLVVPENLPSVLPFVYVRESPHVSKEEWQWLTVLDTNEQDVEPSYNQLCFHNSLVASAKALLSDMEVNPDDVPFHRIYRLEVIEVHSDVSFILLVPGHSDVCTAPGQEKLVADEKRGCLALSVPTFEVAHLCTYQPDFIALYCRMSVMLDFYSTVFQQLQRQSIDDVEIKNYKQRMETLNSYQQRLDEIWKAARWITAVVSSARDKQLKSGLPLSVLFAYAEGSKLSRTPPELDAVYAVDKDDNGARQRRPSSNDGSDPDMEDNSDVGYHSDQSLDRTAGHVDPNPLSMIKNGKIPALNFHALPAAVANPNYELLNNLTKRNPVASRRRVGFLLDNQMCEKRVASLRKSFGANNVSASEDISDSNCNVNGAAVVRRSDRPPNDYGVTSRRRSGSFSDLPTAIVNNVKLYSEHYHKFDCSPNPEPGCSNNGVRRSAPECVQLRDSLKLFKNSGRKNNSPPVRVDNFGVLRVYAAYPCGLVKGTSVKLQVTQKTTSKEVTALVVQQLSKSAKSKGYDGPYYEDGDLNEFCLVAVIGARERCLRDDFAPLDLQNPWSKGKLFVRRRHDLLAALEYGNEAKV